jgi:hypothetical protein
MGPKNRAITIPQRSLRLCGFPLSGSTSSDRSQWRTGSHLTPFDHSRRRTGSHLTPFDHSRRRTGSHPTPFDYSRRRTGSHPTPFDHSRRRTGSHPTPFDHSRRRTGSHPTPFDHSRRRTGSHPTPSDHSRRRTGSHPTTSDHSRRRELSHLTPSDHFRCRVTRLPFRLPLTIRHIVIVFGKAAGAPTTLRERFLRLFASPPSPLCDLCASAASCSRSAENKLATREVMNGQGERPRSPRTQRSRRETC